MASFEPQEFELDFGAHAIAGERRGVGDPAVLCHGLTAGRDQVTHGSAALARAGYEQISYDARGHGMSDPAPKGGGYSYEELVADLSRVLDRNAAERRVLLVGHSMGAHTVTAYALEHPERVAALVLASPVYAGVPPSDEALTRWDGLAEALSSGGIDAFLDAEDDGADPRWSETIRRFTRSRMLKHRNLDAVAQALREVPRSLPFGGLEELEFLRVPTLVAASRDIADPRHPQAVAEAYAERIPNARFTIEDEGASPLPWQGGRLSRQIIEFAAAV